MSRNNWEMIAQTRSYILNSDNILAVVNLCLPKLARILKQLDKI